MGGVNALKIGLSMLYSLKEPFFKLLKRLSKVHVEYVELVDDGLHALNKRRVEALKKIAKSVGLEFTVHAPFADINLASPNVVLRRFMLKRLEKSLRYTSQLHGLLWVFHPGVKTGLTYFYPELEWHANLDSVRRLLHTAKKFDVSIAIENVPEPYPFLLKNVKDFSKFYKELDAELGLALDVGHANLNNQIERFLTVFSDKIVHMHVSDNDGKSDLHWGIGRGTVNWKSFVEKTRETGFDGIIMLESVENVDEGLRKLREFFVQS